MRFAVAATVADLGTFLVMLALRGSGAEANPMIHTALAAGFLVPIVVAKLGVVLAIMAWHRAVGRYERHVWIAGICVGLLGATANLLAVAAA